MLSNSHEENRDVRSVNDADNCAHHVSYGIALGDDKPVQRSASSERGVEVLGLSHGISTDECLLRSQSVSIKETTL